MKTVLVVGSTQDAVRVAQREPFFYNQKSLQKQLNFKLKHARAETFSEMGEVCKNDTSDIVFFLPGKREDPKEAERVIEKVRSNNPDRKLIFLDPFAQANTWYFNLLPYLDAFVKRQAYQDLEDYDRSFIGGSKFTDFISKYWQIDFEGWSVNSPVPQGYNDRIVTGWNLGTAKRFLRELRPSVLSLCSPQKTIDIFCRLSLGNENQKEWYYKYRKITVEALESLQSDYQVAVSGGSIENGLVSQRQYYREIKRSRIVFSPFGWGESCWRDFEAVCYNCLLVKPSMSHLKTEPNIFIEGETYVPVRWDLSDLEAKCRYYLEHPEEANRIIQNARNAYEIYFKKNEFNRKIDSLVSA